MNASREIEAETKRTAREGDLRVWWIPQLGMSVGFEVPVQSAVEGRLVLDALGRYDLFQLEHKIKPDFSNAGGLSIFRNGEWEDWEDDECDDIDAFTLDELRARTALTRAQGSQR